MLCEFPSKRGGNGALALVFFSKMKEESGLVFYRVLHGGFKCKGDDFGRCFSSVNVRFLHRS